MPRTTPATSAWADRPVAAARTGAVALLALLPVAVGIAALTGGRDGALGALLGAAVPALVLLVTWAAVEIGRRRSAQAFAALLMGSYLVKLVAVGGLLAGLSRVDSVDRTALGVTAVVGLLVAVAVEGAVVARSRVPYVEP